MTFDFYILNLFDTHCHLDLLEKPIEKYENALKTGINNFIIPSVNYQSLSKLQELTKLAGVYYAAGIHPTETQDIENQILEIEKVLVQKLDKLVAIGECGLDFAYAQDDKQKQIQIALFQKHIDWALKFDLPLIIHNRKANQELFSTITAHSQLNGVFHCFAQGKSFARQVLEQTDFYFGIGGLITLDQGLAEIVKIIPIERIVLETDSPYLVPKDVKNAYNVNESAFLVYTAKKLAQIKGINVEEIARISTKNAKKLFNI